MEKGREKRREEEIKQEEWEIELERERGKERVKHYRLIVRTPDDKMRQDAGHSEGAQSNSLHCWPSNG